MLPHPIHLPPGLPLHFVVESARDLRTVLREAQGEIPWTYSPIELAGFFVAESPAVTEVGDVRPCSGNSMCVSLLIRIRFRRLAWSQVGKLVTSAPRIDQPANQMHGIQTAADHKFKRRNAAKDSIPVPKLDPLVGQIVSVANVQPLVDPNEITDP